ncbi:MAG TPA: glutathione S-transferase [Burkholderiaceae bacterium]|nr:glutathione S-transferase [Burkholderiaceae bacterium]
MITLCGIAISNYYSKVKLALLEKGIAFEEERVNTGSKDEAVLSCSPLGKVPFIRTPQGPLCESEAIMAYLEALQPTPPLLPADPYAAAKVRELTIFIELHVELVARELYGQAFFGGTASDHTKASVGKRLGKNIPALKRLAKFSPYVAGDTFTQADCAAWPHLPLVGIATRLVLGEDLLLAHGVDWKAYAAFIGQRPHAQKVTADRKASQPAKS